MKTTAIIVAAGTGSRFNSKTPKQFVDLAGKPLIVHTIERFQAAPSVDSIIVVVSAEAVDVFGKIAGGLEKVSSVVVGAATRAGSVRNGLNAVDDDVAVVAVHDGARPLVSVDEIERTIARAKESGAACLVAAVTDTIKTIRGDEISGTLDRTRLRRALTPQAFKIEIIRRAFENVVLDENVTDECYLVEKLGYPISFVEGSPQNIKITHSEDLAFAEAMIGKV